MSGVIGYAAADGISYFKLGGELRHDSAAPLEALIEHLFENQPTAVRGVVIDLNDLHFMDSTVIGLLASIARTLMEHQLPPATVFSTAPEINALLRSLCLDEVFTLVEHATHQASAPPLESIAATGQCTSAVILKAHEVLIELNEANRIAFQPVVDLFRAEIDTSDPR